MQALEAPAAEVDAEHAETRDEAAVGVGPEREQRRQEPEQARLGGLRPSVAEDPVEDEDLHREEGVREHLGPEAPARRRGERHQEHSNGRRGDAGALAPRARHHKRQKAEGEEGLQDREAGPASVVRHEGEGDLAQVLVVDPGLGRRRVGVRRGRRQVPAREDVLAVANVPPEVGVRAVDGGEDEDAGEEQRDEERTAQAFRRLAA